MIRPVIFIGFNAFDKHKRGVENVIDFQASLFDGKVYYLHWDETNRIYKKGKMICLGVNHCKWWKYLYVNFLIITLARRNKGIFLHSHNTLISLLLYRNTDLFTVHDGLFYQHTALGTRGIKKWMFYLLEKCLYLRCRNVHFISRFAKSRSLYPSHKENYTIIYNSSNYELILESCSMDAVSLKEKFPFLIPGQYFFSVRSIEERARIDLLIDVAQIRKDMIFVVAGKGPLLEFYRDFLKKKGIRNVILLGFVSDQDLFLLYKNCRMVIVPAEYGEGFGLPIIEGYLFNKAVIASDKCAIPEVIEDKTFLFDNVPESLIQVIGQVGTDRKKNYRAYYDQNFSYRIISESYKNYYYLCMG